MPKRLKRKSWSIDPARKAVCRVIQFVSQLTRHVGLILLAIASVAAAAWLGFQQFMLRQQAANLQNQIGTLQKDLDKTPKSVGQTPPATSPVVPYNPIQFPQKSLGQTLDIKDQLTLQKELVTLEKERITIEHSINSSLIQALGGLFIFVTAYIAWLNWRVAQEKQTAERFSKAVEQLGSEKVHVRLGGIYALEQIAKDAEEKYYWQVMETLTAFVREESPFPPKPKAKVVEAQTGAAADAEIPSLTDIQAVLTVLSRRNRSYQKGEPHSLNLSKTDIQGLHFIADSELAGVDFTKSNLTSVNLRGANLREANFRGAILEKAKLEKTDLKGAKLGKARLKGAKLAEANLKGARMRKDSVILSEGEGLLFGDAIGLTEPQIKEAKYIKEELPDHVLQNSLTTSVDEPSP